MRAAVLVIVGLATACQSGAVHDHEHEHAEAHWGYQGDEGPEHWAELSPDFALCASGRQQSPIDLTDATPVEGSALERGYGTEVITIEQRATVMDLVDNGHTIQVSNDVPVWLDLDGERFELVQYHFHAPSEHTIDGKHFPLEAHYVHKSAAGRLAGVGVLIEEGEHQPLFGPILAALPAGPGESRHLEGLDLEMSEFKPLAAHYYRYTGSLTTPPCSEDVLWIVMANRRQASPEQIAELTSHLHDNNRPVQPLNDRQLVLIARTSGGN